MPQLSPLPWVVSFLAGLLPFFMVYMLVVQGSVEIGSGCLGEKTKFEMEW